MKQQISFAKLLTKKDVLTILKQNNYSLAEDLPQPISRYTDKNGEFHIVVKCIKSLSDEEKEMNSLVYEKMPHLMFSNLALSSSDYSFASNVTFLEFSDFTLLEILKEFSMFDDEEKNRELMKNYHNFMKEKFGTFYVDEFKKYRKKLLKECEKNNENNENE